MKQLKFIFSMVTAIICFTGAHAQSTAPASKETATASVVYQCPMICEGDKTYDRPGRCPVCGMNLKASPTQPTPARTESFKVWENCGMCKKTIEDAVKKGGVSNANWDPLTKKMTVIYNPDKISLDDIQKKIAAVGYDTEKYEGNDEAYENLHGCCQYERKN